jgi:hypothetical protein
MVSLPDTIGRNHQPFLEHPDNLMGTQSDIWDIFGEIPWLLGHPNWNFLHTSEDFRLLQYISSLESPFSWEKEDFTENSQKSYCEG